MRPSLRVSFSPTFRLVKLAFPLALTKPRSTVTCCAAAARNRSRMTRMAKAEVRMTTNTPRSPIRSIRSRRFPIARHNEQRRAVELIDRPQALGVVVLGNVHDLLLRRHVREWDAVVEAPMNADQPAILLPDHEIERQVAERHRHDRVERVGVARAHQIAKALVDDVDPAAL